MSTDIGIIAAAIVSTLAPFLPFLVEVGKAGGEKLAEVIAEKGGKAAWERTRALWGRLKARLGKDSEMDGAVKLVAAKPEDESRQAMLAEVLGARLREDPALAQELFALLGGQKAVQQVLAERGSWVEDVVQRMQGTGAQTVWAKGDSVIKGVRQKQGI